ncbi:MAG: DUF2062 domain-containing protein [Planctomycetes bacterium]|nr:DUF2062 domain-containing protein [Planctomycetota bacterium]
MTAARPFLKRLRDWFVHLLHLDDSASRIALGAAVGMFVAMTPTIGLQMLIVLFLLTFIPGNRVAGLPMVWITNPATAVPIYVFNYRVGAWILGGEVAATTHREWAELVKRVPSFWQAFHSPVAWVGDLWSWLGEFWKTMEGIIGPLWLGSAIVGLAAALVTYAVMYYLICFYRLRLRDRLQRLTHIRGLRARRLAARHKKLQTQETADHDPADAPPEQPAKQTGPKPEHAASASAQRSSGD